MCTKIKNLYNAFFSSCNGFIYKYIGDRIRASTEAEEVTFLLRPNDAAAEMEREDPEFISDTNFDSGKNFLKVHSISYSVS